MFNTNQIFKKNTTIIQKTLADGLVLIDPYRRVTISLNEVGLEIWGLIDGERTAGSIIDSLKEAFDADPRVIEKDAIAFMNELAKREMIQ
jgi:hypothetical protein